MALPYWAAAQQEKDFRLAQVRLIALAVVHRTTEFVRQNNDYHGFGLVTRQRATT
jgi:hypothetical protein